jgi:hypothetical protein
MALDDDEALLRIIGSAGGCIVIKAKTAAQIADHIESYMRKVGGVNPGRALEDASEAQMRIVLEALRRSAGRTSQG